jgi:hypothetical protein
MCGNGTPQPGDLANLAVVPIPEPTTLACRLGLGRIACFETPQISRFAYRTLDCGISAAEKQIRRLIAFIGGRRIAQVPDSVALALPIAPRYARADEFAAADRRTGG